MKCVHGSTAWYIKGANNNPDNIVGQNCIQCWQTKHHLLFHDCVDRQRSKGWRNITINFGKWVIADHEAPEGDEEITFCPFCGNHLPIISEEG